MRKAMLAAAVALLTAGALLVITHHTARQAGAVGLVLVIAGVPLMLLSRAHLGKAFSVGPKATTLVTRGLYARIPHPMYVFLDLVLLGIVIAIRQRWLLLLWLALIAVQTWQARRESRILAQAFGDEYKAYRAQTWW